MCQSMLFQTSTHPGVTGANRIIGGITVHAPSGCQSRSTSCSAPDPPFRALLLEASAPLNRQHIHDNKYGRHKSALLAFSFSFSFFLRQFLVNLMKSSQLNQLTPLHSRYILPYFCLPLQDNALQSGGMHLLRRAGNPA